MVKIDSNFQRVLRDNMRRRHVNGQGLEASASNAESRLGVVVLQVEEICVDEGFEEWVRTYLAAQNL